jgi:hypothetical protein
MQKRSQAEPLIHNSMYTGAMEPLLDNGVCPRGWGLDLVI